MTEVFKAVLQMSAIGTVFAAVLILLRAIMKRIPRLRRKYTYALWVILCVRLLCPVSLSSSVSLFNALETPVLSQMYVGPVTDSEYDEAEKTNVIAVDTATSFEYLPEINGASAGSSDRISAMSRITNYYAVAAAVWAAGMTALIACCVVSYAKMRRRVSGAKLLYDNVYLCDSINTPFVFGIIKPRIYLPYDVRDEEHKYILAHERMHISRLDHIVKPVALAAFILHWFNPIAWLCYALMTEDMEFSCDEGALECFDRDVKKEYASALLNISLRQNRLTVGMLSFGESNIKARIKGVLAAKKPAAVLSVAALLLLIAAAVYLLINAVGNDGIRYADVVNIEYNGCYLSGSMWAAPYEYGIPEEESAKKLFDRMRQASPKKIIGKYERDIYNQPITYTIEDINGDCENSFSITFERGIVNGIKNVPCCTVKCYPIVGESTTTHYYFKEKEWNEIITLFTQAAYTSSLSIYIFNPLHDENG